MLKIVFVVLLVTSYKLLHYIKMKESMVAGESVVFYYITLYWWNNAVVPSAFYFLTLLKSKKHFWRNVFN